MQQNIFIDSDFLFLPIFYIVTAVLILLSIPIVILPIFLNKTVTPQAVTEYQKGPEPKKDGTLNPGTKTPIPIIDRKISKPPGNMTQTDPDRAAGSHPSGLRHEGGDIKLKIPRLTESREDAANPTVSEGKAGSENSPSDNEVSKINIGFIQAVDSQTQTQTGSAKRSSCGKPWKTPLSEIQGKIKKVEYRSPLWTDQRGLHLDVETDPQHHIVIHVFPEKLIGQCSNLFKFEEGEVVTVSGSAFLTGRTGRQQNLCAATITRNTDTLELRNPATGTLEKKACCKEICKKNCAGKPSLCGNTCIDICNKIKPF